MNDLINQPDAPRLIYGLRDTGYSFNTAAADIIDNSIAANATEVNVRIELAEDGRTLIYSYDTRGERTGITALLNDIAGAGLKLRDVQTRQSSLEDIFVSLVEGEDA